MSYMFICEFNFPGPCHMFSYIFRLTVSSRLIRKRDVCNVFRVLPPIHLRRLHTLYLCDHGTVCFASCIILLGDHWIATWLYVWLLVFVKSATERQTPPPTESRNNQYRHQWRHGGGGDGGGGCRFAHPTHYLWPGVWPIAPVAAKRCSSLTSSCR